MNSRNTSIDWADWERFVDRLYAQNEFAIKLGLEPMKRALEAEGHPERAFDVVLIAGTNGKGGTSSFLASILQAHGRRVGLFTSPHVVELRERIRVDGRPLGYGETLEVGRQVLDRYGGSPDRGDALTFFELTTLMGIIGFRDADVDVAVFEVGLGGRLDATNALEPELSVITNIALDHQEYLGESIGEIAAEKCGVVREGKPVVAGPQAHNEAMAVIEDRARGSLDCYGREFDADPSSGRLRIGETVLSPSWSGPLPAERLWNASTSLQAAFRYLGEDFDARIARAGLERTRWPGRWDVREVSVPHSERHLRCLFDAAHNPDSARRLFDFVRESNIELGAVLFAAMADKDIEGMLEPVPEGVPLFGAELLSPRAASADSLAAHADFEAIDRLEGVIDGLTRLIDDESVVLVFGSLYLIGECFEHCGIPAGSLVTYDVD